MGTYNQILNGKFREKYAPLLNFVSDWIRYDYIVNRPTNSLFSAITGYLQNLSEDAVYEIWIFYKILQLLEPIKQSKRHHHKLFTNNQDHISIQYQSQENISWKLNKAGLSFLRRIPDVIIRKDNNVTALIGAKYMLYRESDEESGLPGPDRDIVNQMIIYLDYIGPCMFYLE